MSFYNVGYTRIIPVQRTYTSHSSQAERANLVTLIVELQFLSNALLVTVQPQYIRADFTVCSRRISQSPSSKLITYPSDLLRFSRSYAYHIKNRSFRKTGFCSLAEKHFRSLTE